MKYLNIKDDTNPHVKLMDVTQDAKTEGKTFFN